MSSSFYIPPPGIYFRLLGHDSQQVLVSRNAPEPEVFYYPYQNEFDDQFFSLIPGTGEYAGLYLIKGKVSGKFLYSRTFAAPYVWHIGYDDPNPTYYVDNWFKLEPSQDPNYVNMFRLVCPYTNTVVFSRVAEPYLGNVPATDVYSDQYFSFLFEDMEFVQVNYNLELATIKDGAPYTLETQTLKNDTVDDTELDFELNQAQPQTATWEYTAGFTIASGFTFNAGIPAIENGKFQVKPYTDVTWKFGDANTFNQLWKSSMTVKAGPEQSFKAVATVQRGQLQVPYTLVLRSKETQLEVETTGTWTGVSTWDLNYSVTKVGV